MSYESVIDKVRSVPEDKLEVLSRYVDALSENKESAEERKMRQKAGLKLLTGLSARAAFSYAEKVFAGEAEKAGFKSEEELQEYVRDLRRA